MLWECVQVCCARWGANWHDQGRRERCPQGARKAARTTGRAGSRAARREDEGAHARQTRWKHGDITRMPTLGEFIMPSPALRLPPPSASRPSWPRILVLHIYMSRPSSTLSFSPPSLPRGKRQLTPAVRRRLGTPNRSSGLRRVGRRRRDSLQRSTESRPHALRAAPGKAHELSSAPPHHRRQFPPARYQTPTPKVPTLRATITPIAR